MHNLITYFRGLRLLPKQCCHSLLGGDSCIFMADFSVILSTATAFCAPRAPGIYACLPDALVRLRTAPCTTWSDEAPLKCGGLWGFVVVCGCLWVFVGVCGGL